MSKTKQTDILEDAIYTMNPDKVKDFKPFKDLLFDIYKACYMQYGQARTDKIAVDLIDLYKEAKGV